MTQFISIENNSRNSVVINGEAPDAPKTNIEGDSVVQLRRARQEESGFDWLSRKIEQVTAKNVLIFDQIDASCLAWFIDSEVKIDFSASYISPVAIDAVVTQLNFLADQGKKAVSGSKVQIPNQGGYSGMARTSKIETACRNIGLEVIGGYLD